MPSIAQNTTGIRRRLGQPLASSPNDQVILQVLIDSLLHQHSQLAATNNHWNVNHFRLQAAQNVEDYLITAPNFGRPFLIYTVDDTDPYHVRYEVPVSLLQDADRRYDGPVTAYSSYKHSAAEICFYRTDNVWYARLVPVPNNSGDYEIWYDQTYEYAAPSETPGLEVFHHLVRVQSALSLIPHTEWHGVTLDNPDKWQIKMDAVRDALLHDEIIYQRQFNEYRSQMTREGVSNKLPYGWMTEDDFGAGGRMIPGIGW